MSSTTKVAVPAGEWTVAYTASGTVSITIQNLSRAIALRMRIGTAVTTGDSLDDPYMLLNPGDRIGLALINTDKVLLNQHTSDADNADISAIVFAPA